MGKFFKQDSTSDIDKKDVGHFFERRKLVHESQNKWSDKDKGYDADEHSKNYVENIVADTDYTKDIVDTKNKVGHDYLRQNHMWMVALFELPAFFGFSKEVFVGEPKKIEST